MLPKKNRLNGKAFKEVFDKGKRVKISCLNCIYSKSEKPQFSVVVPKKISPNKAKSNIIKRRFYQALENVFADTLKLRVIFILNKQCLTFSEIEYREILQKFFSSV